ncbi:Sulfur relay (sulfurtransferase) complex TusC component, DsrF/TusC family [Pseudidiomarina indica]|uniref:Sulfur relay (Sulfurtransferase) complex TusC component, DsrF/TusC family n=1 Tax=Pseudidiomarina indica TaxID=1159017 RepID=A0A1G6A5C6_9GAMM|nr:hypothetical protein [Pseudidiomarina indica]SDB03223.1 Sulfur relay (sulfurtransferase) complex TusC component, DsrF/TusC family [Pseudidiomarina indica]
MTIAIIQTQTEDSVSTWLGQDLLLALASHDLNPQLILTGMGLRHCCYGYDAQQQQRSLHKRYGLLELFDCPKPWVRRDELVHQQLTAEDFILPIEIIEPQEWAQRIAAFHQVLVY